MRLTVLGNPDRYLAPYAGGSCYLLEHEGKRILLDAGQGAREALVALGSPRLDAVWISHTHFDHVLDLPTLPIADGTPILLPRGEKRRLDALAEAYVWGSGWDHGTVRELDAGDELDLAGLRWTFSRNQHSAPALAARFDDRRGTFVYASDSAACAALAKLAEGADLLLMHALLPDVDPASNHARVHATGRSAGKLAHEARARRLLLSHRYHETKDEEMLAAAGEAHADVVLATRGAVYDV